MASIFWVILIDGNRLSCPSIAMALEKLMDFNDGIFTRLFSIDNYQWSPLENFRHYQTKNWSKSRDTPPNSLYCLPKFSGPTDGDRRL